MTRNTPRKTVALTAWAFRIEIEVNPGLLELGFQRKHELRHQRLKPELDIQNIDTPGKSHRIGEFHDFLITKILLKYRLVPFKRGERCPHPALSSIGLAQVDESAQLRTTHTFGTAPKREISLGQIGQPGLLNDGVVSSDKFGDFHKF